MKKKKVTKGKEFNSPVTLIGSIGVKSNRLIIEKPYELTRFEYSILRKPLSSDLWFNLVAGATAGIFISLIGKSISALIAKQNPSLELWEIISFVLGILISCFFKFLYKSDDEQEKTQLMNVVNDHFKKNKPRGLNMRDGDENEN